ncbi:MAG: hypothetical protein CMP10_09430 [Zetaproteobacteria bacterium]|nr:hypothetical protein [Pseudobdellovibrionaceae bacterium]
MYRLMLLSLFIFLTSCSSSLFNNSSSPASEDNYDLIIARCHVPQGNGGNWASTLGWLSETVFMAAQEAEAEYKKGKSVGLSLSCMAGGSSGSIATTVFMNLLRNPNLIANPGAEIISIDEAKNVANALKLIGISADVNSLELMNFYRQVILETVEGEVLGGLSNIDFLVDFARKVLGNETPSWWKNQRVQADQIIVDFIVANRLALTMTKELLSTPIQPLLNSIQQKTAESYNLKTLVDLTRFPTYEAVPDSKLEDNNTEVLNQIFDIRVKAVNQLVDEFLQNQFPFGAWKSRYLLGAEQNAHPLIAEIAEMPLANGFCTITMSALYETKKEIPLDKAPDYKTLKALYFCSAETIDKIMAAEAWRADKSENPFLNRYVFIEPQNTRAAIALSVREPGLMTETAGIAGELPFELVSWYQSKDETLKRQPITSAAFAIAGGFPDRRITAWPISYFFQGQIKKFMQQYPEVRARVEIFGKPDNRQKDKFDTNSIRNIFSNDSISAQENIDDWFSFQDSYCSVMQENFSATNITINTTAFNWDITGLPAAQSRVSAKLIAKGINAVRLQHPQSETSFVYDPLVNQGFITETQPIPCTLP